jgi:hypothetical protein
MTTKRFAIIILVLLGLISGCASNAPMSAAGMTEEDRATNDTAVILEELAELGAEQIEINYARDAIKVYLAKKSSDQYVSDDASRVRTAIPTVLKERRSDLTLEKDSYHVYIYGSDKRLLAP